MADLQVCYFCGEGPDSSLGEYVVVPPSLDPTDDQQASVVLCPDCREKLTTVMEPVVEAAGAQADGPDAPGGGSDTDPADGSDDASPGIGSDPPDRDSSSGGPEQGSAVDDDSSPGDDPLAAPGPDPAASPGDDAGPAEDEGVDVHVESPPDDSSADDGVTVDDDGNGTAADDQEMRPADRPDDPPPGAVEPAEGGPPRDQPHADDELVGRNNEAYNKTLRLLQNREFPVERHEIEQVAANAYQLDPQEVSDAIDALIRKGLLTQEGAQLVRP